MSPAALIALLTDFGLSDPYVGMLHGVIAGLAPQVPVVDLGHRLPRGDVPRAAFALWQATPYFPPGTIFVCVVDPGVGTARRATAMLWDGVTYVGPDNGAASYLIARDGPPDAYELTTEAYRLDPVSSTFHGRDVFAPAAAHLANGLAPNRLGMPIEAWVQLPLPRLEVRAGHSALGEVLHADRFGNCITSLGILRQQQDRLALDPWLRQSEPTNLPRVGARLELPGGLALPLSRQYADVPAGDPVAYVGSSGLLEIGVNQGSALEQLGLVPGQPVLLENRG